MERERIKQVEYDGLTGLYHMDAFRCYAQEWMQKQAEEYSMLVLDVLNFSSINSIYGEKMGDEVLQYIAKHLQGVFLPHGDEKAMLTRKDDRFYVLYPAEQGLTEEELLGMAAQMEKESPIPHIRLRLGVLPEVDKSLSISLLCDRLNMSLRASRNSSAIAYHDESMERKRIEEQKLLMGFDRAIRNREFVIWIQPKVELKSGKIKSAEALIRWIDNEGRFISPGAFIPLFEREGLIRRLDEYIFEMVCRFQREQREQGRSVVPISINLSRNSLFSKGIVERYCAIARREGVELELVPIEITESAATSELQIQDICNHFVEAGFSLHMDDFGTGYSSLSSLVTLPFSVLKLDKSLIDNIGTKKGDIIIKNIITIAQDLNLKVVAEGVEEQEQVYFLRQVECDSIQGYYFSPPKKAALFRELLEKENPFEDKLKPDDREDANVLRMTAAELKRYLRVCKTVFSAVRVLDEPCGGYCVSNEHGDLSERQSHCYAIWNRSEQCSNCISVRTLTTKQPQHKFQLLEGKLYLVFSTYVEVDGFPRVLEMVNAVGNDIVYGLRQSMTMMDAVLDETLYMDKKLGVYNYRFLKGLHRRLSGVTAVAVLSLDGLNTLRSEYGEEMADRALKQVAETIKPCIRRNDKLIYMGADRFLLTFDGMNPLRLEQKLVQIRSAVHKQTKETGVALFPVIAGCTCLRFSEDVVHEAERLLEQSRKEKNGVAVEHGM